MSESIPRAGRVPILGSALEVGRDPFGFLETAADEHGPVFRVSIPGLSFVCYADADLVERALVTERDRYRKDERELELLGALLGDGLLTARGEDWERGRERVQPAFYPGRLRSYADEMVAAAEAVADGWDDGRRVDVHDAARRITLEVVASTMFGLESAAETETIARAADAITSRFEPSRLPVEVPLWVPTPSNRRFRRAVEDLEGVVNRLLERHREDGGGASIGVAGPADGGRHGATDGGDGTDDHLLATLLSAREAGHLSDDGVRDHLLTMLLAGHETTAIALTYALALLATHPEEHERVVREVRDADDLSPSTALPHTDRVVRETLRLYPPVYVLFRQTTAPDTVAGYDVPADTRVVLPQWAIHRSGRYYDDPLAFRPDRWDGDLEGSLPDFAYFPFGGGPRQCIGRRFALLELRLTIAALLRSVRLEPTAETELSPTPALTSRPDGPVWLRVRG